MKGKRIVVDTNVAIAANGRNTHADELCQLACVEALANVAANVVFLDDKELIFTEYAKHLNFPGQPGMGDAFFKHVFDHQHSGKKVRLVPITPTGERVRGFEELPANTLDASDRKFLAVAVTAKACILNATDSDWAQNEALLKGLSVKVEQLCPHHCAKAG
jgi:predicted nucleic acid-binding protein